MTSLPSPNQSALPWNGVLVHTIFDSSKTWLKYRVQIRACASDDLVLPAELETSAYLLFEVEQSHVLDGINVLLSLLG